MPSMTYAFWPGATARSAERSVVSGRTVTFRVDQNAWQSAFTTDAIRAVATESERHRANWQDEIDSVALYRALADLEADPRLADVYRRLAAVEDRHAGF
jgi:hypothetical protein